jgi:hypothetical protein
MGGGAGDDRRTERRHPSPANLPDRLTDLGRCRRRMVEVDPLVTIQLQFNKAWQKESFSPSIIDGGNDFNALDQAVACSDLDQLSPESSLPLIFIDYPPIRVTQ